MDICKQIFKKDDPWINNGIKESKIYLNKIFELSTKKIILSYL